MPFILCKIFFQVYLFVIHFSNCFMQCDINAVLCMKLHKFWISQFLLCKHQVSFFVCHYWFVLFCISIRLRNCCHLNIEKVNIIHAYLYPNTESLKSNFYFDPGKFWNYWKLKLKEIWIENCLIILKLPHLNLWGIYALMWKLNKDIKPEKCFPPSRLEPPRPLQ